MESPMELKAWPVFANVEVDFLAKVKSVWVYRSWKDFRIQDEDAMILTNEDQMYALGPNARGQHGVGDTQPARNPRKVPALSHEQVVEISFGRDFALALTQDGAIYSWGVNWYGQLGHETTNDGLIPKPIEGPLRGKRVTSIACGYWHSLALTDSGEVFAWGSNWIGQLGDGSQNDSNKVPQKIQFEHLVPEECHAVQISCGADFSIILLNDGRILSFGKSNFGQLGHGNNENQSTPTIITALRQTKIVAVRCGFAHVLALSDMEHLYSWGGNKYGQLGNGSTQNSAVPTRIGDENTRFTAIETNWSSSYMSAALNESNQTYVWGWCKGGYILTPTETQYKSLPEAFYFHSHKRSSMYLRAIRFTSSGTSESQPRSSSYFFQAYEPLSWLGSGGFGAVMKVRCIQEVDKALMAVKMTQFDKEDSEESSKEIGFLKQLTHENVVRYYSHWVEEISDSWEEQLKNAVKANDPEAKHGKRRRTDIRLPQGETFLFIATELCSGGTLEDYIFTDKKLDRSWEYFQQIVSTISYIHTQKIIHRDLKPSNVFIGEDGQTKIGDFGLARSLENSSKASTFAGTHHFMAPEIFLRKPYKYGVDIFAVGKILAFLIHPFKSYKDAAAKKYFKDIHRATINQNGLDELISKMINENPEIRPKASDLVGLQCPIETLPC